MPQRTLKVYIEDTLYKEVTVETDEAGGYSAAPILGMIAEDKQAGLLNNIPNYDPNHLSIRIELGRQ